ncbi:unnamed protein product [Blepharisma stoltei]|uniref:Thioredoxin domain-containing protein n=1 Tax=Blepharisma stoltei TaxID=1481888 RepID=A0AAU9ITI6_9CILI|nr:unnamed protein product [Blepharisma stoltei]
MVIWLLIPALTLAFNFGNPKEKPSMEEALRIVSEIKDDVSTDITEKNFDELIRNSKDPWFVYFYHPESVKCTFYSPQWKFFSEEVKEKGYKLNTGKVNMEKNMRLVVRLEVQNYPAFLYFVDGQYYNYTGPNDDMTLPSVHLEKLYLQYDHKPIPFRAPKEKPILDKVKDFVLGNTVYVAIGGAVVLFVAVFGLLKAFRKNKPKTE